MRKESGNTKPQTKSAQTRDDGRVPGYAAAESEDFAVFNMNDEPVDRRQIADEDDHKNKARDRDDRPKN